MSQDPRPCPDCDGASMDRRHFLKTTSVGAAAAVAAGAIGSSVGAADQAAKPKRVVSETLVKQLYGSLTDQQKKLCAFGFDHPLRKKVNNNWHITDSRVAKHFDKDQQDLIRQIFLNLHSVRYAKKVLAQVEHDNQSSGGFGDSSIALFGEPGSGKFEFVLASRHVTRRCDGDSVDGAAFGGPIFYGHAAKGFNEAPDHPGNIYWYQAKRANELFQALDGKQRKVALRSDPRPERANETVKLNAKPSDRHGLPLSELTSDQKGLAEQVLNDLLAPFRQRDRKESMKLITDAGLDNLQISYYNNDKSDIGGDGVWDVWQIEGPNTVWYFRGAPHVHVWVNIASPTTA